MLTPFRFTKESQIKKCALNTLQRIQATLSLSDTEFSEFLELTPQCLENILGGRKPIPLNAFVSLSDRLNLNLEDLYHGRVDYPSLEIRFNGDPYYIPSQYSIGAGSRFVTVINILNYVEKMYGWHKRIQTLRHFQMSEGFLASPDRLINFRYMTHLLTYLNANVMPESEFFKMGQNIIKTLNKPLLMEPLKEKNSLQDTYEHFFKDTIRFIDRNYIYTVKKLTKDSCVVSLKPNPTISQLMQWKNPGNFGTCTYRAGVLTIAPIYLDKVPAQIRKIKCVHQGDSECQYHLSFS